MNGILVVTIIFGDMPIQEERSFCFPRIVWTYWDKNLPEDVEEMLDITKKSFKHFTHLFLMDHNLSNFLDVISFSLSFNEPSEKADYVRVCLIEKYGGMWMDAGTIVNSELEMELIFSEILKERCMFVGFTPKDKRFRIIAGFFGAPRNSGFMKVFKRKYDEMISGDKKKYISQSCKEMRLRGYEIAKILCVQSVFAIDFLFHKIIFDDPDLDKMALYLPQNRSTIRLYEECARTRCNVTCRVLHDVRTRKIPFIKLGRGVRPGKKFFYEEGRYLSKKDCYDHPKKVPKKWKHVKKKSKKT